VRRRRKRSTSALAPRGLGCNLGVDSLGRVDRGVLAGSQGRRFGPMMLAPDNQFHSWGIHPGLPGWCYLQWVSRGRGEGQGMMVMAVPSGAQRYIHSATSIGRLTQPWLIGAPKLLCQ
jgi:hypothetical protein